MRDRIIRIGTSIPILSNLIYGLISIYKAKDRVDKTISFPNDISKYENSSGTKWIIQTSVPRNKNFKNWGDYFFAQEIIESLQKQGHDAYIAFRSDKFKVKYGDKYLVLRGLYPFKPLINAQNIMWVISHPEQVSNRELNTFKFVFAASDIWANAKSKKLNRKIDFLPQASNPRKFKLSDENKKNGIVFVGNAVSRTRPIVQNALKLGFEVKVIGQGWNGKIPESMIISESIENNELPKIYASSCIVLNDHWVDMQKNGFISNRIYDAVSAGATVVSDYVLGAEQIPNVFTYTDEESLRRAIEFGLETCKSPSMSDNDKLNVFAEENSFDDRVSKMLEITK